VCSSDLRARRSFRVHEGSPVFDDRPPGSRWAFRRLRAKRMPPMETARSPRIWPALAKIPITTSGEGMASSGAQVKRLIPSAHTTAPAPRPSRTFGPPRGGAEGPVFVFFRAGSVNLSPAFRGPGGRICSRSGLDLPHCPGIFSGVFGCRSQLRSFVLQ